MSETAYVGEMTDRLADQGWEITASATEGDAVTVEGTRGTDEEMETLAGVVLPASAEQVTVKHVRALRKAAERTGADRRKLATEVELTDDAASAAEELDVEIIDRPEHATDERGRADAFAERTGWPTVLLGSVLTFFALGIPIMERELLVTIFWLCLAVVQAVGIYRDAGRLNRLTGWPRLGGWHYVAGALVPGINVFVVLTYLLNRAEVRYYGGTLLPPSRVPSVAGQIRRAPRATVSSLYVAAGVVTSVVLLTWLLLLVPTVGLWEEGNVAGGAVILGMVVPVVVCYYRRYSPPDRKQAIDRGLRDLSIRVLAPVGLLVFVIGLSFVLYPIALGIALAVSPLMDAEAAAGIAVGILASVYLLPIAAVLVMPIRLLPWVRAAPYILRQTAENIAQRFSAVTPGRSSGDGTPLLPVRGHNHTDVSLTTTADVSMPGTYGYDPKDVQSVTVDAVPWSLRTATLLAVPGLLYATAVFAAVFRYPERMAAYASVLPAEDILLFLLSYFGVPGVVTQEVLAQLQLPPETLSLGFVGGLVPAVMLIPAAWHLALAYESLLYRLLQRLGNRNHLLLLWVVHVVPVVPLFAVYRWLKCRGGRIGRLLGTADESN